jgi:hypothetical protein
MIAPAVNLNYNILFVTLQADFLLGGIFFYAWLKNTRYRALRP